MRRAILLSLVLLAPACSAKHSAAPRPSIRAVIPDHLEVVPCARLGGPYEWDERYYTQHIQMGHEVWRCEYRYGFYVYQQAHGRVPGEPVLQFARRRK